MIVTVPPVVARAGNSEVRKVTSVRVNRVVALAAVVIAVVVFGAFGLAFEPGGKSGFAHAIGWSSWLVSAVLVLSVVGAGVFGAIASGQEYRDGSLALSALFTPDRNLLLGAKLAVTGGISLATVVVMEVLGGAAMLLAGRSAQPVDGGFFLVLLGVALAVLCWAVIGASAGFLLRSPILAVAAVLSWTIVEPLVWITARAIGFGGFATVLPVSATVGAISGGKFAGNEFIAPTPAAMVLLVVWTGVAGGGAWWYFTRRDI